MGPITVPALPRCGREATSMPTRSAALPERTALSGAPVSSSTSTVLPFSSMGTRIRVPTRLKGTTCSSGVPVASGTRYRFGSRKRTWRPGKSSSTT